MVITVMSIHPKSSVQFVTNMILVPSLKLYGAVNFGPSSTKNVTAYAKL